MIGRLTGILQEKTPPFLLIDVGGVGYEVQAPMSTIYQLPNIGEKLTLLTHFHVREDVQCLFGFNSERERALFRSLIKISGIGPKMALTILSGMDVNSFIQCVESRETASLVRLPGVGKKTAERLIIEMNGKFKTSFHEDFELSAKIFGDRNESKQNNPVNEAISALIALGYKPQDASRAVARVEDSELSSQELIRLALKG